MDNPRKRQVAFKTAISEIISGQFIKREGWEPSYVIDSYGREMSRVNVLATAVSGISDEGNARNVLIDDGSGRIILRSFDDAFDLSACEPGSVILVIGKVREYNEERFIIPEIIKKQEDTLWVKYRKKELEDIKKAHPKKKIGVEHKIEKKEEVAEETISSEGPVEKVFSLIRKMDTGKGALIEDIIKNTSDFDAEKIIDTLLKEGDLFQVSPGRLKVLE